MIVILHQQQDANLVEKELERYAVAINFNWNDASQAKLLAMEFKDFDEDKAQKFLSSGDRFLMSKANFFGLARTMLELMGDGAKEGVHIHGGNVWKSFAKELYKL